MTQYVKLSLTCRELKRPSLSTELYLPERARLAGFEATTPPSCRGSVPGKVTRAFVVPAERHSSTAVSRGEAKQHQKQQRPSKDRSVSSILAYLSVGGCWYNVSALPKHQSGKRGPALLTDAMTKAKSVPSCQCLCRQMPVPTMHC